MTLHKEKATKARLMYNGRDLYNASYAKPYLDLSILKLQKKANERTKDLCSHITQLSNLEEI